MDKLPTIGRTVYAIPMAVFGLVHFMNASAMAGMVPIPGGVFWVWFTGVAFLAAAVAIISGRYAALAAGLLGVMLLIFVLSVHLPGVLGAESEQAMQASMTHMLKDTALAGGAWAIAGQFLQGGGGDSD